MPNKNLDPFITHLSQKIPTNNLFTDEATRCTYSYDNSRYQAMPDVVIFAEDHQQIQEILRACHTYEIPLTARGRGTATTGAAIPVQGGVVLSLERMNKIIKTDPDNRVMVVQPGVLNNQVQLEAKQYGFFWPPDPTSSPYCSVGGNLGCNAAGPRAVKYGSCRENTLGLTAVTAQGDLIKTGFYTTKASVGYDLTRLLIGSEGTLAVITEAILKLTPLPETVITLEAFYKDMHAAAKAVAAIMAQPVTPCALEFMDGKAIQMIREHAQIDLRRDAGALLIIEVDGQKNAVDELKVAMIAAASNEGLLSIKAANTPEEVKGIWDVRKALAPALRNVAPKKINEDIVVPVANIPRFIETVDQLGREHQINIINFGHAGNGNIHVNLLIDPNDPNQQKNADICLEKIFDTAIALRGTLSGEHGIGIDKRTFIHKEINPATLDLMRSIKNAFDPKGILNPGKIFPEAF